MPKTINTGGKLDETLHTRIKNLSAIKERSPHWLMKAAIEEYVAREEAYEQEKREDQERWQRYKQSGHAIANDAVNRDSEQHHQDAFLRMVCGQNGPWFLLHIWDGRYAAFWDQGFDGEHCIAVAEHRTNEDRGSTWPFALISENREEVERYINDPQNGL